MSSARVLPFLARPAAASSEGWLLVGLILFLSAVLLALTGITFYLTEHLRTTSLRQNQTKAVYLAQAGVMWALYDFRRGAGITLRSYNVDNPSGPAPGASDDTFILQTINNGSRQAHFLLVNMRGNITFPTDNLCPATGPGRVPRDQIQGWSVRNILASGGSSLTITQMRINWAPDSGEGILRIDLNDNAVWTAPCATPGAINTNLTITSQTLSPGTRWDPTRNRVWFTSTAMEIKDWIEVTLLMSDGSERTSRWDRLSIANRSADATITSVGEVREGVFPFVTWRRLRAEHRACRAVSGTSCDSESEERTQEGALVSSQELLALTP